MTFVSKDPRILNLTRGCLIKPHQAAAKVKAGVAAWVERGTSIRELSWQEVIAFRQCNRRFEETLEPSEVHGVTFVPPASARVMPRILSETLQFYKQATAQ